MLYPAMDDSGSPFILTTSSNKRGPLPSTSLTSAHIAKAIERSSDNSATLMFSKMRISDIGVLAVQELANIGRRTLEDDSQVKRIALGHNHLTTLPTEFVLLTCLRYLNLKHNSFSVFPEVLASLPSLDTLDISHNNIKQLPSQAGHLVHLRVFCLSKNKISRLPLYISQFDCLEVLQVERNPIKWPPKIVMEKTGGLNSQHTMKHWVRDLQLWMESDSRDQMHDDSGYSELHSSDPYVDETYNSWKFPFRKTMNTSAGFTPNITPHTRSFSEDSTLSLSSPSESVNGGSDRAPLRLGMLGSFSPEISPTRSLESYLPSPVDSAFFDDGANTMPDSLRPQTHTRNASFGGTLPHTTHGNLLGKKSMPDLRNVNLLTRNADIPESAPAIRDLGNDDLSTASFPMRQDSSSSLSSNRLLRATPEAIQSSPTRPRSSITLERNSYFQRVAAHPTVTGLPQPLRCLVQAARSILFATCQVYQTLEYYAAHAIDDRISSVLRKVLDPASIDMQQLINSLDRFDAMSRKILPSPSICRNVLESCRDTVAVVGKAVGVLALQLNAIIAADDVRYSRWILLELYGATAEISSAWLSLAPQIEAIQPLLRSHSFTASHTIDSLILDAQFTVPNASPIVHLNFSAPPKIYREPSSGTTNVGLVRTARRHAGSFSSKDVEIGKKLPSYDDTSTGVISGIAKYTPTLRGPKRHATIPITTISSPSPTMPIASASSPTPTIMPVFTPSESSHYSHSRHDSQVSLQESTSTSLFVPSKTSFLDLPSTSKSQVSKEAVQAVQAAVLIAPAVWDMIDDLFRDPMATNLTAKNTVDDARIVTARLSAALQTLQGSEAFHDRKDLREDAHTFLKTVVQLSNAIKTYSGPHVVSSTLRTNMVKLTNSTEEFAILLHVSSFSPVATRPHSPFVANSASPEELRLFSGLPRSSSAHHTASFKRPTLTYQGNTPLSLPALSFHAPSGRLRSREGTDSSVGDPG